MLPIGVVSQQTGISIDALRKWEVRYGFPNPVRSDKGQRFYSAFDVEHLKTIYRLIRGGISTQKAIKQVIQADVQAAPAEHTSDILNHLLENRVDKFQRKLAHAYKKRSREAFVYEIAIPLIGEVGDAWQQGRLPVYAEHLFSRYFTEILSCTCTVSCSTNHQHQLLLATPSQELHFLGIEMFNALLVEKGYQALKLGADLPNDEIVQAADDFNVSIVALSASIYYPPKLLKECLIDLREKLPSKRQLWIGGAGAQQIKNPIAGISFMNSFQDALSELDANGIC